MDKFISPTYGAIDFDEMVKGIISYVEESPDHEYRIMVGSDSQKGRTIRYVVSIVVQRVGKGARYYYSQESGDSRTPFQARIIHESVLALEVATRLKEALTPYGLDHLVDPIHADVGNNGATKELIRTITGMIMGSGFEPVIKPEGIAACTVADKHSKF